MEIHNYVPWNDSMRPPAFITRSASSFSDGLWSLESAVTRSSFDPVEVATAIARESPELAQNSLSP